MKNKLSPFAASIATYRIFAGADQVREAQKTQA